MMMRRDAPSGNPEVGAGAGRTPGAAPLGAPLALVQGVYYLVTGIWPLVSIGTFQKVTGPKVDLWLVKTAGVLITAIGAALVSAGVRKQLAVEIPLLAVGSAAGLTGIEVVYVARKRISPVYLLDAAAEVVLILGWALAWRRGG
ncbi:MAG: hypothetical protein M3Q65_22650 [Chloroflexota bacterium]|nr:hypothetical protein [Chloroflexota bacterium]